MAEDALPEPMPGQTRPDAKGHCPLKQHLALNGGCWGTLKLDKETCEGRQHPQPADGGVRLLDGQHLRRLPAELLRDPGHERREIAL